jgi:myo-inositol-1(or 4)-monophosphatase
VTPLEAEPRAWAAARLAVLGGRIARDHFQEARGLSWKPDGSMVTDADLEVQRCLEEEIARRFPSDDVLGEEATGRPRPALQAPYWWLIDPIDGTNNFGRHLPGFCVSVGILREGQPFAGAIYDPLADWLFTAAVGLGAWLNGEPLTLTPRPLSSRSLFAIRAPYGDGVPAFVQSWLERYRLRRFGSTALQLCYVALGGLAFVHDHRASLWDIAAAVPVLLEAGAVITGEEGEPLFPRVAAAVGAPIALVAGDPATHRHVLADIAATSALSVSASTGLARQQ